ncbi:MAG TPA: response regulator [Burkholderiaceae bacterium]|nr:response regulator [Burkholderiaceae bacterium]
MKTILVVDDELANAEVLAIILEEEGYRVFCASNGRHGLQRAAEVRPHLIVLDFMMPIMDGAEMARALRDSAPTRDIPIVMNSSLHEEAVREHFADYDYFLRKPYDIGEALEAIARLLKDKPRDERLHID